MHHQKEIRYSTKLLPRQHAGKHFMSKFFQFRQDETDLTRGTVDRFKEQKTKRWSLSARSCTKN